MILEQSIFTYLKLKVFKIHKSSQRLLAFIKSLIENEFFSHPPNLKNFHLLSPLHPSDFTHLLKTEHLFLNLPSLCIETMNLELPILG